VRFVCAVIRVSRCEAESGESPASCVLVYRLHPVFLNQFWGANFLHPVCEQSRRVEQLSFRQDSKSSVLSNSRTDDFSCNVVRPHLSIWEPHR
jgi:hypothetical protein